MIGAIVWRLARPVIAAVLASSLIAAAMSGAYAAPSLGLQSLAGADSSGPTESVRFISPDPWDPTIPGVGTNRYAYADNDPINKSDPSGHIVPLALGIAALGAYLASTTEANAPGPEDPIQTTTDAEMLGNMALGASAGMSLGGAAVAPEGQLALEAVRALAALNQAAPVAPAKRDTGVTVLGHYPEYVELSDVMGARRYQISNDVWDRMTEAQRWEANVKFLDRTIARKDKIRLATPVDKIRPGTYYEREIDYMKERGYSVSKDGRSLEPPSEGGEVDVPSATTTPTEY